MARLRLLAVLFCLCAFSSGLIAQAPGTGLYAFGSFDNRGFDSINIGNLDVHFEIPIVNKTGRGVPFKYTIVYDGLIWSAVSSSGIEQWQPDSGWGFHGQVNEGFVGHLNYNIDPQIKCFSDPQTWYYTTRTWNYNYYDAFGQQHNFNYATDECQGTTTGDGSTSDGSGFSFDGNVVHNRYGAVIQVPENNVSGAGSITDTNGNVVHNNGNGTFTDTLGITALTITGGGNANSPRVFTYNIPKQTDGSTTAAVTMSYKTYTVQTHFGCSDESGQIAETGPLQIDLVYRITLADGTFYQFNYETTPGVGNGAVSGRLASITLPTGGTISYQYFNGCNGSGISPDGTVAALNRTTSDGSRIYGRGLNSNGSITNIQDEIGNWSAYTFTNINGIFYETHRQIYQGAISGTPLFDQQTCYNNSVPCDGMMFTLPVNTQTISRSLDGNPQTKTVNGYYGGTQLLASTQNYDASNNLWQDTYYSYNGTGGPTSVVTKDGAGNLVSQTTYGYDEQTPTPTSNIPQHNSGSSYGNQTSSHAWIDATHSVDTSTSYYDTGVPISTAGPTGTTQYSYEPTQGFATQVTPPTPSSGVSLPSYASHDVNSGIQQWASDANNGPGAPQVQYAGYDKLLRPTQINTIDGGNTQYNYYPATSSSPSAANVITLVQGTTTANTSVSYDWYGRVERTAVFNGQAANQWYQADYCYDATGRLQFQTVRYQGWGFTEAKQSCTSAGTTYSYDALGRVTNIKSADGNATYQYNGRAVLATDVNGVQTITQTDALGRTSIVCEISNTPLH